MAAFDFPDNHLFPNDTAAAGAFLRIFKDPAIRKVLICGHVRPDGDCVGAMMGLYHYLRGLGKECRIYFRNLQMENLLPFLPDGQAPGEAFPAEFEADATVVLDISDPKRVVDNLMEVARRPMFCIDHHATNGAFADLNWVNENACATSEMIFQLVEADGAMTAEIATCLYFGILSDTGGFRFGNTTPSALAAASRLVEAGARPAELASRAWGNVPRQTIALVGHVLDSLRFEMDGAFVWSDITQSVFAANGGEKYNPDNLSGDMRSIRGVEVAVLLREGPDGSARASMRSSGRVDVARIASQLGGGGHRAAAGAETPGPNYAEASAKILETVRQELQAQLAK